MKTLEVKDWKWFLNWNEKATREPTEPLEKERERTHIMIYSFWVNFQYLPFENNEDYKKTERRISGVIFPLHLSIFMKLLPRNPRSTSPIIEIRIILHELDCLCQQLVFFHEIIQGGIEFESTFISILRSVEKNRNIWFLCVLSVK